MYSLAMFIFIVFDHQVTKKRGPVEAVTPTAKRPCRENRPAAQTKAPQRSIFSFLDHCGSNTN